MNSRVSDPVISVEELSFGYDRVPILEDVNFAVHPGDLISVVGPNGGGKTTLIKLIMGLLTPDKGSIRIFGQAPEASLHRIGYMSQHTDYDPYFPVTVLDVVLMGRIGFYFGGFFRKTDREAAMEALQEVNLEDKIREQFSKLSGGQRRRVLIARALASRPELLLLDEPTANVDALAQKNFFEIIEKLNDRMTIILVSHDLGFVSSIVNRVICVNRQVAIHPTCELTGEIIRDIYGGDIRMIRHDHDCSEKGHRHGQLH